MSNSTATHLFESANLGKAPFRVVGFEVITYQACAGAPVQVGGCCDYCYTGIKDSYKIQGADGRTFKVGSTCVAKTGDKGLVNQAKRAASRIKTARAAERTKERRTNLIHHLATLSGRQALRATPHPLEWRRDLGESMLDWAVWMLRMSGNAGTLKTIRTINKETGTKL